MENNEKDKYNNNNNTTTNNNNIHNNKNINIKHNDITISNHNNIENNSPTDVNNDNLNINSNDNQINIYCITNKNLHINDSIKIIKRKINDNIITNNKNKKQKLINNLHEPNNYNDIFNLFDKNEWLESVNNELNNMKDLNVYETVNTIPPGANLISSRWIFTYKRNDKREIIKRKARLVAKGYTQQYGIDYREMFSPTLKQDSIRIFTSISAHYNFNIEQIDINVAYLNAGLNEDLFMKPQKGHKDNNRKFWKLNKAIF